MEKIKIVIADDHHILLDGLNALLRQQDDIEISGLYNNGLALLNALEITQPQIALIDINMPEMNGVELTKKIKQEYPEIHIMVLSMFEDIGNIMELVDAGVAAYLFKNIMDKELVEAIRTVAQGNYYFPQNVSEKIAVFALQQHRRSDVAEVQRLTERELEILKLINQEYNNNQIAEALFISVRTVETHRKNMLRKTNNKSIIGLLKYARDNSLI